jgi:HPt (histidine-containing phosphotransfer) domain-containing protein
MLPTAPERETKFDVASLLTRCMDDSPLAMALLERFAARLPAVIADVESAMAASDWSAAASKVHRLSGEAANLSAVHLQAQAINLEGALRASRWNEATACLPLLRSAADECIRSLPAVLGQLQSSRCETTPCG